MHVAVLVANATTMCLATEKALADMFAMWI